MKTTTRKLYPVSDAHGYFLGNASTAVTALRLIRKFQGNVSKVRLSRAKKPVWQAVEWEA